MSHDRGCACGKEPYEYDDCNIHDCMKKERTLKTESDKQLYVRVSKSGDTKILTKQELEVETMIDEHDQYFELGREVEVKNTVSISPKSTTYRDVLDDDTSTLHGWKPKRYK